MLSNTPMRRLLVLYFVFFTWFSAFGQGSELYRDGLTLRFKDDSTRSIRFILVSQLWARYIENNPGTTFKGKPREHTVDFNMRRVLFFARAQLTKKLSMVVHMGITKNTFSGGGGTGQFSNFILNDAYGQYDFDERLSIGAGLPFWVGLSRLNGTGAINTLNIDVPMCNYPVLNRIDQSGRTIGFFAKVKLWERLDYRVKVSDPFRPFGNPAEAGVEGEVKQPTLDVAYFHPEAVSLLTQGYAQWEFMERESNELPFKVGTYAGTKRVFNLGAGFLYRPDGMYTPTALGPGQDGLLGNGDDVIADGKTQDIFCWAVDVFFNYRLSDRHDGLHAYLAYYDFNLGKNYLSVGGIMSPGTGEAQNQPEISQVNGPGNRFPFTGTGPTLYFQGGYFFPKNLWGVRGQFNPYFTFQNSYFDALEDPTTVLEAGMNYLIEGHNVKLTGEYRARPLYRGDLDPATPEKARFQNYLGEWLMQVQFYF